MDKQRANSFMLKMVGDVATTMAASLVLLGNRLQLFEALAQRAQIAPRYAEEWLAGMAGAGYVDYDPATGAFELPDEHAQFLTDRTSECWLAGLFGGLPSMAGAIAQLEPAFRSGAGVGFAEYGTELPEALAAMNRAVYNNRLVRSWLPSVPGVAERLMAGGRAIDIGCGVGVVPIALAQALPGATVAGLEPDRFRRTLATRSRACSMASRACTACRRAWPWVDRVWVRAGASVGRGRWPSRRGSVASSGSISAARPWRSTH